MRQLTLRQQQKWLVKKQFLNMFQRCGCYGLRSELRNSDVWHDYAQIATCGSLELSISLSNLGKVRISVRSHNTDPVFLSQVEAIAKGRVWSIHNDTSKKSCDVLEVVEKMDWQNLGAGDLATLQHDMQAMAQAWNSAIGIEVVQ